MALFTAPGASAAAKACIVSNNDSKNISGDKGESYTYHPNCFDGNPGVKLSSAKYGAYEGKGSTYWYKFSLDTGGDGNDTWHLRRYDKEPNANTNAIATFTQNSDFTVYSKSGFEKAANEQKQTAGNNSASDYLVSAIPGDIKAAFIQKQKAACQAANGGNCSDASMEKMWKTVLGECNTKAKAQAEAQPSGVRAETTTPQSRYNDSLASCLAGKTGLQESIIKQQLPQDLYNKVSNAEKEGQDSVPSPATGEDEAEEKSSCGVDGIGWLVCPAMSFIGDLLDSLFGVIADFLEVKSDQVAHDATRSAWAGMRTIANIAFVIAFLFIIYSQLTGAGISNYGVKRLLPKVIIAAILVNISFIICQLAVDISNLLGYSLKTLFDSIQTTTGIEPMEDASGNGWGIAVMTVGVVAAGIGAAFAISVPVLLAVLLALILIVGILLLRKALIIVLTVISPLAFVAFLLPNTEKWFKKWAQMFMQLLLVFPIISVVFGASKFVAGIVKASASSPEDWMTQLTAVGIAAIPFFIVPGLLKGSMNAAGSIGTKLSGMSGKATARVGKKAMTQSRLGDVTRNMKYKSAARQANRRAGNGLIARTGRRLGENDNKLISGLGKSAAFLGGGGMNALDNSRLGSALGLGAGADNAQVMVDEMFEKDVKAAGLTQNGMTMAQKRDIARGVTKGTTKAQRAAAMDSVMANGGFSDRREMLEHVAAGGDQDMKARAVRAAYAKGDANIYGKQFGDNILSGNITGAESLAASAVNNAGSGDLQAEHLVQSGSATEYISNSIYDAANGGNSKVSTAQASQARASEHTRTKIDGKIDSTFKGHGVN
jgi:hypothetical protein